MAVIKRPTLLDVARLANVSTAVVSYVINDGPRRTSPEAKSRVLRAIDDLGYHPSAVARGFRAQSTRTIGFVVADYFPLEVFVSPYSAGVLTGLTSKLLAKDYYVLIYPVTIGDDLAGLQSMLRGARVDGVVIRLVQDPPATDPLMEVIRDSGVPCVLIERESSARFGFDSVTYDDEQGASDAVGYLISRGHRRIGHIQGDLRYSTGVARLRGYRRGLAAGGLADGDALVAGDTWAPTDAISAVRHLLGLPDPPTAILAASDSLALSAMQAVRDSGLRVPEDVAIIGFDDIPQAQESSPALTTVAIPLHDIGRRAADLLLRRISRRAPGEPVSEMLPLNLIQRGTA